MPFPIQQIVNVLPRLRNPIQLTALVFTLLSATLIYRIDPSNVNSLVVVSALGVGCLVIPLAFHASLLRLIPIGQRAPFLLLLLTLLLFSFGALAVVTYRAVFAPNPEASRFDTTLAPGDVQVFPNADGSARVQLKINFFPLSKRSDEGATVFAGLVVLHDEERIQTAGVGTHTPKACTAVDSCIGAVLLDHLPKQPLLVRAASPGFTHTLTVDIKHVPKTMRVWWEFYQREGPSGAICNFDNSVPAPTEGIPKLAMYDSGQKIADFCYRSTSQHTLQPSI